MEFMNNDELEFFEERAAIFEYDAGCSKQKAEHLAKLSTEKYSLLQKCRMNAKLALKKELQQSRHVKMDNTMWYNNI